MGRRHRRGVVLALATAAGASGQDPLGKTTVEQRIVPDASAGFRGFPLISLDTVSEADRARDKVRCGAGRDRVRADRKDRVRKSCERIRRRR
jgi:hypothetical protein